jgi:hypothetical protein
MQIMRDIREWWSYKFAYEVFCSEFKALGQACQTGGPNACSMGPAAILSNCKVAENLHF